MGLKRGSTKGVLRFKAPLYSSRFQGLMLLVLDSQMWIIKNPVNLAAV
jgi:hypothetical protein